MYRGIVGVLTGVWVPVAQIRFLRALAGTT
jgi:hypothetical protein